jgi:hypothetical protein
MPTTNPNPATYPQRTGAALLLAFILLPFLALLIAANPAEASRPACCRTHGKHHCLMPQTGSPSGTASDPDRTAAPQLRELCPCQNTAVAPALPLSQLAPNSPLYAAHRLPLPAACNPRHDHQSNRGPPPDLPA